MIDYAGFTPTADGLADGEVASDGLLSVTTGLSGELDDANAILGGLVSVNGSTLKRNAAYIDYASKNCSASADSGSVTTGDLVVQCAGTF